MPKLAFTSATRAGSMAAGLGAFKGWRFAGHAGAALGVFLLTWIAVQIAMIGFSLATMSSSASATVSVS